MARETAARAIPRRATREATVTVVAAVRKAEASAVTVMTDAVVIDADEP